ncbi:hypothetical protein pb186bvf_000249 [Paramecium bursaria]
MLVFCMNVQHNVFSVFQANQISYYLSRFPNAKVILNQAGGTIEQRANYFKEHIKNLKQEKLSLVGFSLAGLDLRYALSGIDSVTQLITVGTPHKGSFLAEGYRRQEIQRGFIDPISRVIGVQTKYFEEVNPQNIRDFNFVTPNKENVRYSSIDAETLHIGMKDIFIPTSKFIEQKKEFNVPTGSDGVFLHKECRWGDHLITLDCDHSSLLGYTSDLHSNIVCDIVEQLL